MIHVCQKIRLLTFVSGNYASTAGGYAAVTKGLIMPLDKNAVVWYGILQFSITLDTV